MDSKMILQESINQCCSVLEKLNDINVIVSSAISFHHHRKMQQDFMFISNNEQKTDKKKVELWNGQFKICKKKVEEYIYNLRSDIKTFKGDIRRQSQDFENISKHREEDVHMEYQRHLKHFDYQIEQLNDEIENFENLNYKEEVLPCTEYENVQNKIRVSKHELSERMVVIDNMIMEKALFEKKIGSIRKKKNHSEECNIQQVSVESKAQILGLLRILSPSTETGTLVSRVYSLLLEKQVIHIDTLTEICANRKAINAAIMQLENLGIIYFDPTALFISFKSSK